MIRWTTGEPATSLAEYGTTTSCASAPSRRRWHGTNRQLKNLAPALLDEPAAVSVQQLGGRVDMLARRHNGALYIVAVNVGAQATQARFNAPELAGRTVPVWEEGRTITADSSGFSDSFAEWLRLGIRRPVTLRGLVRLGCDCHPALVVLPGRRLSGHARDR